MVVAQSLEYVPWEFQLRQLNTPRPQITNPCTGDLGPRLFRSVSWYGVCYALEPSGRVLNCRCHGPWVWFRIFDVGSGGKLPALNDVLHFACLKCLSRSLNDYEYVPETS